MKANYCALEFKYLFPQMALIEYPLIARINTKESGNTAI